MPTDESLALGVQQGKRDKLAMLVERHHSPLLGFLYRMTNGNRVLAEDLGTLIIMLGTTERLRQQMQSVQDVDLSQVALTEEEIEYWETSLLVAFSTTSVLMIVLAVAIPIIMAERIPYDREYGVGELLDSLPLGRGTYLTGKLLGTWTGLLLGLASVMLLGGLLNRLLFGPYLVGGYLLSFIRLLPLALFAAGVSVMLGAGQPNRRRAVLVGLLVMIYSLVNTNIEPNSWKEFISSFQFVYMEFVFHDVLQSLPDPLKELGSLENSLDFSSARPRLQIITALAALQVALGWLITWRWMRWREGR